MKRHLPLAAILIMAFAALCFAQPQATASPSPAAKPKAPRVSKAQLQKQLSFARSPESVKPNRILTDVRVDAELHGRACFAQFIKSRKRNRQLVTDPAHIDDRRRGLLGKKCS